MLPHSLSILELLCSWAQEDYFQKRAQLGAFMIFTALLFPSPILSAAVLALCANIPKLVWKSTPALSGLQPK